MRLQVCLQAYLRVFTGVCDKKIKCNKNGWHKNSIRHLCILTMVDKQRMTHFIISLISNIILQLLIS